MMSLVSTLYFCLQRINQAAKLLAKCKVIVHSAKVCRYAITKLTRKVLSVWCPFA